MSPASADHPVSGRRPGLGITSKPSAKVCTKRSAIVAARKPRPSDARRVPAPAGRVPPIRGLTTALGEPPSTARKSSRAPAVSRPGPIRCSPSPYAPSSDCECVATVPTVAAPEKMSLLTSENVASAPTSAVRVESGCASARASMPIRFAMPNSLVGRRTSVKLVRNHEARACQASRSDATVRSCAATYPLRESVRAPRSAVSTLNG